MTFLLFHPADNVLSAFISRIRTSPGFFFHFQKQYSFLRFFAEKEAQFYGFD